MAGLPRKYAKMGFAKGWKAYKASKRKSIRSPARKTAKRATSKRGPVVAKRKVTRKKSPGRKIVRRVTSSKLYGSAKGITGKATTLAINTAIGVGGAAGSAAVINMLPIADPKMKALTQLLSGMAMVILTGPRMATIKTAGMGASLAGALALLKTSGVPLPGLAGERMGINAQFAGNPYRNIAIANRPAAPAVSPFMGVNATFSGRKMSGYGSKFTTQANM